MSGGAVSLTESFVDAAVPAGSDAASAAAELREWELVAQAAAQLFEVGGGAWTAARPLVEELLGCPAASLSDVALVRALGQAHAGRARHLRSAGDAAVRERAAAGRLAWARERLEALRAPGEGPARRGRLTRVGPAGGFCCAIRRWLARPTRSPTPSCGCSQRLASTLTLTWPRGPDQYVSRHPAGDQRRRTRGERRWTGAERPTTTAVGSSPTAILLRDDRYL